ncbi:MAG: hypothetical protein K8R90_07895 [Candidatus Cloacimonetes bacterium]|nr:hypothetical protein [Candidatus Cloacimonadota bacterium]
MKKATREQLTRIAAQERVDSQTLERMLKHRPGPPPGVFLATARLLAIIHQREDTYR